MDKSHCVPLFHVLSHQICGRNNVCTGYVFRLEVSVVLLTESQPVPSVVPLEHHLLPFLRQLHQLLLDLTQAVIQSHLHISNIKQLSPKTCYYPRRISIVK